MSSRSHARRVRSLSKHCALGAACYVAPHGPPYAPPARLCRPSRASIRRAKSCAPASPPPPAPSPMGRGEHASQKTQKTHQNPTSPPAPLPWGEGSMLHKKQKTSPKPTKKLAKHEKLPPNPQKVSISTTRQASPPHELRKGRAASPRGPFAIRGAWGDWSPHKKLRRRGGLITPQKKEGIDNDRYDKP